MGAVVIKRMSAHCSTVLLFMSSNPEEKREDRWCNQQCRIQHPHIILLLQASSIMHSRCSTGSMDMDPEAVNQAHSRADTENSEFQKPNTEGARL